MNGGWRDFLGMWMMGWRYWEVEVEREIEEIFGTRESTNARGGVIACTLQFKR